MNARLRFEILKRDNFTCRYCGRSAAATELRVDHVIPVALGGSDMPDNLVAACHDCNAGKSSITLDLEAKDIALAGNDLWRSAMAQAASETHPELPETWKAIERVKAHWLNWEWWYTDKPDERFTYDLPEGWEATIKV